MSKITFRADDDLVDRIEALDASKSEVMREALRAYLAGESDASDLVDRSPAGETTTSDGDGGPDDSAHREDAGEGAATLDEVLFERVDRLVSERLDAKRPTRATERPPAQDVNVNVTLEDARTGSVDSAANAAEAEETRKTSARDANAPAAGRGTRERACDQCGDEMDGDHVYCPNCGEKATHRVFCDCGDELRSDWAFCPGCGRRTPAADVLDGA